VAAVASWAQAQFSPVQPGRGALQDADVGNWAASWRAIWRVLSSERSSSTRIPEIRSSLCGQPVQGVSARTAASLRAGMSTETFGWRVAEAGRRRGKARQLVAAIVRRTARPVVTASSSRVMDAFSCAAGGWARSARWR
jgi:hypothetical protein